MSILRHVVSCPFMAIALTAWTHAEFVPNPGPDGGLIEDFNDEILDTDTWSVNTMGGPFQSVSEENGELKLVQTMGFNGAYSTRANGIDEGTGLSDGSGLVEPKTAGNNNHRVRAIMRRHDPLSSIVSMGLSITTNVFLRTCGDVGDYLCLTWAPNQGFVVEARNNDGPGMTPTHVQVNQFAGEVFPQAPYVQDLTGKTRYLFEINWTTNKSAELLISEILGPDLNNDLSVDILDFGVFASDFGKSGSIGTLFEGELSDFTGSDESMADGQVDILDFAFLAGQFGGGDPIVLYERTLDWSFKEISPGVPNPDIYRFLPEAALCADFDCWPTSMGVQFYAHNVGTLLIDYVMIFGDNDKSPGYSPEPATLTLFGVLGLWWARRRPSCP